MVGGTVGGMMALMVEEGHGEGEDLAEEGMGEAEESEESEEVEEAEEVETEAEEEEDAEEAEAEEAEAEADKVGSGNGKIDGSKWMVW